MSFANYHKNDQILPDIQIKFSKLCYYFRVNVCVREERGLKFGMEISIHFLSFLQ